MRRAWTTREVAYLREHYPAGDPGQIAEALGRSLRSVQQQASRYGIGRLSVVGSYTLDSLRARCHVDDVDGEDACWLWRGAIKRGGIPHGWHEGRLRSMRQVVMELFRGVPSAPNRVLAPACGCHECLNPLHLKEVHRRTVARQNYEAEPAVLRTARLRRQAKESGRAKLDEDKARSIRVSDESAAALAARYGVSESHVRRVRSGRSWADAGGLLW